MNFFLYALGARLKQTLTPSFAAAFLLLPALILALGLIFNRDGGLALRIGILQTDTPVASSVLKGLSRYDRTYYELVMYTDEERLKQDVATRKLARGYAFSPAAEDFANGAVIAYHVSVGAEDAGLSGKILDLAVASAYVEAIAGEIGAQVLTPFIDEMDGVGEDRAAEIQSLADGYLQDGALMEIVMLESGGMAESEPAPYRRLFHGLMGLFALLLALLSTSGFRVDTEKCGLNRFRSAGCGSIRYALAGLGAVFVVTALFVALTVSAGAWLYPELTVGWYVEALMGFCYSLGLSGSAALLSRLARGGHFPAVIAFIFVFAALLGGTVFDIREVLAEVGFLRYLFPNYYYLEGVYHAQGMSFPAAVLAASGVVTGALAVAFDYRS